MPFRKSCFMLFVAVLAVMSAITALPLHSSTLTLTARQLAAGSPHVVVAVVEDTHSRWNAERSLIVTDYGLRIEEQLKGDAPKRVTLTVPGGTVGEETHFTSFSTFLETGARYLLFLEDFGRPTLTPVTGGWQGVYAESTLGVTGFGETLSNARALLAEVEAHPKASDMAWLSHRAPRREDPTLPSKTWDSRSAKFRIQDPAVAPISFNLIQPGSRYYHVDWDQMAYWNVYAEIFRPTDRPTATWAFGNGIFDVAGFQTEDQMRQHLGVGWGNGAFTILVRTNNGHTIEADLAFNPAYEWSLDDDAATRPGGPFSFKHYVLSSLGLIWGYYGPDNTPEAALRDSVMSTTLPLATLFAEDTAAIRSTFPGTTIQDGLISSYTVKGASPLTFLPVRAGAASVKAGKNVKLLNPVKIENAGTETFTNPNVAVYLVPQRFSMEGGILLKKFKLKGAVGSGQTKTLALGPVKVPTSVPAGSYYFAFVLEVSGDGYLGNNRAWSDPDVKITVTRR